MEKFVGNEQSKHSTETKLRRKAQTEEAESPAASFGWPGGEDAGGVNRCVENPGG